MTTRVQASDQFLQRVVAECDMGRPECRHNLDPDSFQIASPGHQDGLETIEPRLTQGVDLLVGGGVERRYAVAAPVREPLPKS